MTNEQAIIDVLNSINSALGQFGWAMQTTIKYGQSLDEAGTRWNVGTWYLTTPDKSVWEVFIVSDTENKAPLSVVRGKTKDVILAKLEAIEYGISLGKTHMRKQAIMGLNATIKHIEGLV